MVDAHERKKLKYYWGNVEVMVGARGFTARSLDQALSGIGVIGATKSRANKSISDTAEKTAKGLCIKCSSTWEKGNYNQYFI